MSLWERGLPRSWLEDGGELTSAAVVVGSVLGDLLVRQLATIMALIELALVL